MRSRVISGLLVATTLCLGQTKNTQSPASSPPLPRTVDEAVTVLKTKWLSDKDRDWFLRNPKDTATAFSHFGLGLGVRNSFKLWGGNTELMASCGVSHPDSCSGIIISRLWESIRNDANPDLVRNLDCQFRLVELIHIDYKGFYALRLGEMLGHIQEQIDSQRPLAKSALPSGCEPSLRLQPVGNPNLKCHVRAEFSEDGRKPSLDMFLGWIGFRNSFDILHSPPEIKLSFRDKCAWPERPRQFQPKGARRS